MPPIKQKTITIQCDTPDVEIKYTTDDSEPSESSNLYTKEFEVEPSATIKARAYKLVAMENAVDEETGELKGVLFNGC